MSIENIVRNLRESKNSMTPELQDIASELHQKLDKEVTEYMVDGGFPREEVKDYTRVDVTFQEGNLYIEIGAELSYRWLDELCDKLNPIVAQYDEYAYFEPAQPGIIVSYVSLDEMEKLL